jgi:hypothetical protein
MISYSLIFGYKSYGGKHYFHVHRRNLHQILFKTKQTTILKQNNSSGMAMLKEWKKEDGQKKL